MDKDLSEPMEQVEDYYVVKCRNNLCMHFNYPKIIYVLEAKMSLTDDCNRCNYCKTSYY